MGTEEGANDKKGEGGKPFPLGSRGYIDETEHEKKEVERERSKQRGKGKGKEGEEGKGVEQGTFSRGGLGKMNEIQRRRGEGKEGKAKDH